MEPFALVKMMGTFVANGMTGRIVLYLLLLAAGVGVRCVLQRRRDFRAAVGISVGLWLVCEILVDIGAVHEMSIGLFSAAAALGAMGLMFALGLLLCALCLPAAAPKAARVTLWRPPRDVPPGALSPRRQLSRCTSASQAPAAGSARHSRRRTP